jgi:hypothetical protein
MSVSDRFSQYVKSVVDKLDWERILSISPPSDAEWWHLKFYTRTDGNNGLEVQANRYGTEIPYQRGLFHLSSGRFSLPTTPVAYFGSSWMVATIELCFRGGYTDEELNAYCRGELDPTPSAYGYPICVNSVSNAAKILDLTPASQLVADLGSEWDGCFYEDVLHSRNKDVYPATQYLASYAYERGFGGILYNSAQVPTWGGTTIRFKEQNLVLFDQSCVETLQPVSK